MNDFKTKKEAKQFLAKLANRDQFRIEKKLPGMVNRTKKPYVVCTNVDWLQMKRNRK